MNGSFALDKVLSIAPGKLAKTAYVSVDDVVLACKDPMSIGDVQLKYEIVKQNAPKQLFPCPTGHYREDGRFVIVDGRHTYLALLMNGFTHILVSWEE
ncbi:hypothetical protein ASG33_07985 [Dyadobacter sp. Leaf189]|nr:hypothetical protein ASG33_07985 [Dyadobacter sp. Leaf189]